VPRRSPSAPAPPAAPPWAAAAPWLLLAAFTILGVVLVLHHEPWRDEADFWLQARDAPLAEIVGRGGYVGTPALWTLLLVPFAKAGFPYATLGFVNLAIAAGAVALLLRFAPFPLPLRALFAFSYFFAYEYAIVARSYALGVLLAFALAALHTRRDDRPRAHGALLALLFNVNVHAMALAAPILAWRAWETLRSAPERRAARWIGVAIAAFGAGIAIAQVLPPPDGQLQGLRVHGGRQWIPVTLTGALFPSLEESPAMAWWAAVVWLACAGSLVGRPRALMSLVASSGLLWAIFVWKYPGSLRHWGYLLVAIAFALWIAAAEDRAGSAAAARRRGFLARAAGAVATVGLYAALGWSVYFAWRNWDRDFRYPFSESRAMARHLVDHGLTGLPIAAWPAPMGEAVLPYLPIRRLYYPGIRDSGSYMRWDRTYEEGMEIGEDEVLRRVHEAFPPPRDVLLLTNRPLAGARAAGFAIAHVAAGQSMTSDERYVLYRRVPAP